MMRTPHRQQRGFSLMEVLITLFVFAIGILTVAGLQIVAKKSNFDAVQRTTASMLANDILERMRANLANNGGFLDLYLVENLGEDEFAEPAADCTAAVCTPAQIAAWDMWEWRQALVGASEGNTGGLVQPAACIRSENLGGPGIYHIIIAWRGVSPLSNPGIDAGLVDAYPDGCGTDTDKFTDDETGAANVYRRVVVTSTYITP